MCRGEFVVVLSSRSAVRSSLTSRARRVCWWAVVPEISQHDRQTSFDISELYPPPLLNLFGAVLFVFSTFAIHNSSGGLLALNSRSAQ